MQYFQKHFFDLRYNTLPIGFVPKLIDEVKRKFNSEIKIDFCNKDLDIDFKDFYSNLNLTVTLVSNFIFLNSISIGFNSFFSLAEYPITTTPSTSPLLEL